MVAARADDGGTTTPLWLQDDAKIEVDLAHLQDYAKHLEAELKNFKTDLDEAIQKLAGHNVPFGGGKLSEGESFREVNDLNKEAMTGMVADVLKGLATLSSAANAIAEEYGSGDALSKATNDSVYTAFDGDGKRKMLFGTAPTGPADGQQAAPGQASKDTDLSASTDPVSGSGTHADDQDDPGAVLNKGTAGEYDIDPDDEHVKSVPLDIASADDGRSRTLAPGEFGRDQGSSSTIA